MARQPNTAETVQVTVSTTPVLRGLLNVLVGTGFYGKNAAEAAERILSDRLMELLNGDDLQAELLKAAHRRLVSAEHSSGS